jgi:hypothetical protein
VLFALERWEDIPTVTHLDLPDLTEFLEAVGRQNLIAYPAG